MALSTPAPARQREPDVSAVERRTREHFGERHIAEQVQDGGQREQADRDPPQVSCRPVGTRKLAGTGRSRVRISIHEETPSVRSVTVSRCMRCQNVSPTNAKPSR